MGRHKQEYCAKSIHKLEGHNAILKLAGSRQCRACMLNRRKENRKKRMEEKLANS